MIMKFISLNFRFHYPVEISNAHINKGIVLGKKQEAGNYSATGETQLRKKANCRR